MTADATAHPRFKACVEPIIDSDDGLFVFSEGAHAWLPDPIFIALTPLLDGLHTIEEIFDRLTDQFPAEHVFAALDHLRTAGYLADGTPESSRASAAFWEHAGAAPATARARVAGGRVSIAAFGTVDTDPLIAVLSGNGVTVAQDGACSVVVTDDYLRPELAAWNARAMRSGTPWLLVKPVGIESWLGPLIVPSETACWECLAQRLRGHRRLHRYVADRQRRGVTLAPAAASLRSAELAALAGAATEITRWIGAGASPLLNRVVSSDVLTLARRHHRLVRRPQCPSCGSRSSATDAQPLRLQSRPKSRSSDSRHRSCDTRDALERLEVHLSPITGIVSELTPGERAAMAAAPSVTPTLAADHNFSDMHDARFLLREGLRRRSGGKGTTADQVRASALAESLERYSGVFDGTEARIVSTFAELGSAAIHPNACMLYSDRQYAERESHNRRGHKAFWVPEPFREEAAIEWTPLWSLTSHSIRYLPTEYCYFAYRGDGPRFARADSNGCAAGAVLEEAVLQGLLELIERDAVAIWWYNRVQRPAVDLASADDPYVANLISQYRSMQRRIWVLDITSDLGVPTFAALSNRTDGQCEDIIYGFGAHLDAQVALTRALSELHQSLESVPVAGGPANLRTYLGTAEAIEWWRTVRTADARYLVGDPDVPPRLLQDFAPLASEDLYQDVRTCCDLAAGKGIEVLVLDQTRPDVGFPAVRVVAPGLRHFWARWAPGRLYDVPVRAGWLPRPLDEHELNPFVIQF